MNYFIQRTRSIAGLSVVAACALFIGAGESKAASAMAFFNMTDPEKGYDVAVSGPTPISSVDMNVDAPSNVLVQVSAGSLIENFDGCPCSLRVFLRADGGALQAVKRLNIGSPAVKDVDKYSGDRQSIDGSLVFPVEAGTHKFEFLVQQVGGTSTGIRIFYPNLQAIAFPK